MGFTVTFASNRGGVGKSTLSLLVAHVFSETARTVFLDLTASATAPSKHTTSACAMHVLEVLSASPSTSVPMAFLAAAIVWSVVVRTSLVLSLCGVSLLLALSVLSYVTQSTPPLRLEDFAKFERPTGLQVIPSTGMIPRNFEPYVKGAVRAWKVPEEWIVVIDLDNTIDHVARFAVEVADVVVIPSTFSTADYQRIRHDPRNGSILDTTARLNKLVFALFNRVSMKSKERPAHSDWEFTLSKSDETMRDEIMRMFREDVPENRLVGFGMMKEIPGSVRTLLADQPITRRSTPAAADIFDNLSLLAGKILSVSSEI